MSTTNVNTTLKTVDEYGNIVIHNVKTSADNVSGLDEAITTAVSDVIEDMEISSGSDGADGLTPFIGDNGNWYIGDTDTGVQAAGSDGSSADLPIATADVLGGVIIGDGLTIDDDGNLTINFQSKSVTPTKAGFTVSADSGYVLNNVVVAGDTDLKAANIKSGVTIFGVTGTCVETPTLKTYTKTYTGDQDLSSVQILSSCNPQSIVIASTGSSGSIYDLVIKVGTATAVDVDSLALGATTSVTYSSFADSLVGAVKISCEYDTSITSTAGFTITVNYYEV